VGFDHGAADGAPLPAYLTEQGASGALFL